MSQSSDIMSSNTASYNSIIEDIKLAANGTPYSGVHPTCYEYNGNRLSIPNYVLGHVIENDGHGNFTLKECDIRDELYKKLLKIWYYPLESEDNLITDTLYDLMEWMETHKCTLRIFISYDGHTSITCMNTSYDKQGFVSYIDNISKIVWVLTDSVPLRIRVFAF